MLGYLVRVYFVGSLVRPAIYRPGRADIGGTYIYFWYDSFSVLLTGCVGGEVSLTIYHGCRPGQVPFDVAPGEIC